MRASLVSLAASLTLLAGCSSGSGGSGTSDAPSSGDAGDEAAFAQQTVTEHGIVYDYGTYLSSGTFVAVSGLTVTDGDQSTTTDAQGNWSLTLPLGSTLAGVVSGTSKGDAYSKLALVGVTATGSDFDHGNIIIPDSSTFSLERLTTSANASQALVHVIAQATGSCTSVAGATLTVTSPPGAQVMYFDTSGYPSSSQTSFAALKPGLPVADIFDLTPGAQLTVQVAHPTCKMVPFPAAFGGGTLTGQVTLLAAEPGDNNAALILVLD